jgi:hypothetical protein
VEVIGGSPEFSSLRWRISLMECKMVAMDNLIDDFVSTIKALETHEVDYVLIGGFAMIVSGFNRLTQVVDVFVRPVPDNIVRLKRALFEVFADSSIEEISFPELEQYAVIRYCSPEGFIIDIISNIEEMFRFEDLGYETVRFGEVNVRVANPETLYKMKKDTLREKDKVDAAFLAQLLETRKTSEKEG